MEKHRSIITLVMYGKINKKLLSDWYEFVQNIFKKLECEANYLSFESEKWTTNKVVTLKYNKKKLDSYINDSTNNINGISLFSEPIYYLNNETSYYAKALIYSNEKYSRQDIISMSFRKSFENKISIKDLQKQMSKFIDYKSIEVFEMCNLELPSMYIFKLNTPDFYKTLNVIYKEEK